MQLKTIGESLTVLDTIKNVLNDTSLTNEYQGITLATSLKKYSIESIKAALCQQELSQEQIKAILVAKGYQGELLETTTDELANISSTNALAKSELAATGTTTGLGYAFEGLAAKLGISTAALGALTAAVAGVVAGMVLYKAVRQHFEEVRQASEEAANALQESTSSIIDYTAKYQELRQALIAAIGNEEETYNVKKQLLELQTQLNDKFGDEYGNLNLVTDAYKDHTAAIKAYNRETAQSFLNENREGISNAAREMTKKDRHYNLSSTGISSFTDDGAALKEIAYKYADRGIRLNELEDGTYNIILTADADSAYDTINAFMKDVQDKADEMKDSSLFDSVLDLSSLELNRAKETIDEYGDIYRQSLIAEIVTHDDKAVAYQKATEAVEAYNEAVLRAEYPYSDENVAIARQNLQSIKDELSGEDWQKYDTVISELFEGADTSLYDFDQALKNDEGLKGLAEDLKGLSHLDLQSFNPGESKSFDALKESAEKYHVSVDALIDNLVRLGYVQGEIQPFTPMVINFDSESFLESMSAIQSGYETLLDAQEEFNKSGSINAATLETLIDNDLLQFLQYTSDGLSINTAALKNNEQALKNTATAELYNAMCNDIQNLSLGDTSTLSDIARTAIASLDSAVAVSGENAATAAAGWWEFSASIQNIPGVSGLTGDNYEKAEAIIKQYKTLADSINSLSIGNTASSGKSSALTDYKSMLDKELDALEKQLDAGRIEFKAYINKRKALIKDYYQYGRISASEYYSELEGTYQSQLDYYDKAISAVENLLNKEIDRIEKANEGLEKQLGNYDSILSAVSSVYDSEIDSIRREQDAIQDTIDALQDENDEREKALKLEQAEYDLHRARTQRTERVYAGEGLGVIYRTDRTAIHEAQENLADLALEQTISGLEEEKDALSSTIEELEIYRDLWAEIPDSKQTEEDRLLAAALWGGEYESFILNSGTADIEAFKNSYTAIQDMIDDNELLIESYKEKLKYWQDISDAHDIQTGNGIAADLFGENWQAEVLSGAIDACNDFKNEYIAIQQAMTDAAWASAVKIVPYASGTTHAGKGLNLVGEKGTETFIDNDGNVSLVTRPSLIPMEGGETVRNARETRSLLDPDNLVPAGSLPADTPASADILSFTGIDFNTVRLDTDEIRQRLQSIMPDYPDMIQADIHLHQYDFSNTRSNTTPVVQNITLTLPNVTNDSGYERIRNELKQMQLDALQFAHRR